jgi:hypothetical protein
MLMDAARVRLVRHVSIAALLAAPTAGLATAFGFTLESSRPVLKLFLALVLAAAGAVVVLTAGPSGRGEIRLARLPVGDLWVMGLALLSVGAGLIHFAVIREHLEEYWLYGAFFVVVAVAQLGWAILVVRAPSSALLLGGGIGNLLVVGVWVVTRTVGPLIGPEASVPLTVGTGDLISTSFEFMIFLGVLALFWPVIRGRTLPAFVAARLSPIIAIAAIIPTTMGLFSAVGHAPFISHVG